MYGCQLLLQHQLIIVCIGYLCVHDICAISPYVIKSSYRYHNGYNHITMCNSKVNQTAIPKIPIRRLVNTRIGRPRLIYCIASTYILYVPIPYIEISDVGNLRKTESNSYLYYDYYQHHHYHDSGPPYHIYILFIYYNFFVNI